jgi:hypothetical protein
MEDVQKIVHPSVEELLKDYCEARGLPLDDKKARKNWVNRWSDVLAMVAHIQGKRDIFVTTDKEYHKEKKQSLIELGAGDVLRPDKAVERAID